MFPKRVENNVGKGEIARYEKKLLVMSNFSFSHIVFKRLILQTPENQGLFGKGLIGSLRVRLMQGEGLA